MVTNLMRYKGDCYFKACGKIEQEFFLNRLREMTTPIQIPTHQVPPIPPKQRVKEMIGHTAPARIWHNYSSVSIDTTKPNYKWWDEFRRGRVKGHEFSALFAKPIANIRSSWTIGKNLKFKLRDAKNADYTNDLLGRWIKAVHSQLLTMLKDLDALGDQYVIVNADGSLSIPSPDTVEITYAKLDYRKVILVTITTIFKEVTVTDVYTETERIITIKNTSAQTLDTDYGIIAPSATIEMRYPNLIGLIPVVHFANERGVNETNGRPVYEPLLRLFSRYNDLIEKGSDGAELLSNPIPVWEGLDDPESEKELNTVPTGNYVMDNDGDLTEERVVDFERLNGLFLSGSFNFKSPSNGFTSDILAIMQIFFLLMLENQQIPETVWGGEMGQARATSQEQMKTFYQMIEGRRVELEGIGGDSVLGMQASGGLRELIQIWLMYRALIDPQVIVDAVSIEWDELGQEDEALKFQKVQYADQAGYLTPETSLGLMDLVEDPLTEISNATQGSQSADDLFQQAMIEDLTSDAPTQ